MRSHDLTLLVVGERRLQVQLDLRGQLDGDWNMISQIRERHAEARSELSCTTVADLRCKRMRGVQLARCVSSSLICQTKG